MISTPHRGNTLVSGRVGLVVVAGITLVSAAIQVRAAAPGPLTHPLAPAWLLGLHDHPVVTWGLVASGLLALALFAVGRWTVCSGIAAVVALGVLVEAHAALVGGPARNLFFAGAALFGWLFGLLYARVRTRSPARPAEGEERFAELAVLGVLAATYVGAAASKLLQSGLSWASSAGLRAVVVSQHAVNDDTLLARYAQLVAGSGVASTALSVATLAVQLGAVLLLGPPLARRLAAAALLAFHANVFLLTHILYGEPMLLLALFAFRSPAPSGSVDPAAAAPGHPSARRPAATLAAGASVAAAALVVGLALLGGVRRYTALHHAPPREAPHPPVATDVTALLGGLAPGDPVAGFTVASIRGPREGRVELTLRRGPEALVLTVVRRGSSEHAAPRVKGDLELFYGRGEPGSEEPDRAARDAALDALAARIVGGVLPSGM